MVRNEVLFDSVGPFIYVLLSVSEMEFNFLIVRKVWICNLVPFLFCLVYYLELILTRLWTFNSEIASCSCGEPAWGLNIFCLPFNILNRKQRLSGLLLFHLFWFYFFCNGVVINPSNSCWYVYCILKTVIGIFSSLSRSSEYGRIQR